MKLSRTSFVPLVGLTALALMLSACNASAPAPAPAGSQASGSSAPIAGVQAPGAPRGDAAAPAAPPAQNIKRGGTFTISQPGSFAGADPAMGQNAYQMWYVIGTYMLRREPDTWKLNGDAIEKWSWSPDGLELTLNVRKGVKWQNKPPVNGRDIEAKDIVYTLKSISGLQYPDMPPLRFPRGSNLVDMEDATVVDPYTVKVKMKNVSSTFLDALAEYRGPITPDQIREHFGGRDSLANPNPDRYLSAGPFTLTKYVDLQEAIYTRYPDYWEKGVDGQSKPYLDQIRNIWINDMGTQMAAFLAGQVSTLAVNDQELRNQVATNKKDVQIIQYEPQSCWDHVIFNSTKKPFDDIRVRQAIALVLDPVETGKTLVGEWQGKPVWRYPGSLPYGFPESFSQEELAKSQWYESPKSQATIDKAKKLMADAGYADGFAVEWISGTTGQTKDGLTVAISQVNKVFPNIKITAKPLDTAIGLERAAKRDYEAKYYCYIHEPTAVAHMKTVYHTKGGRNFPGISDPQMDDLLDKAGRELDADKRLKLLRDAQTRAFDLAGTVGAYYYASMLAIQPEFRGIKLGGGTNPGMYYKEWWLDK